MGKFKISLKQELEHDKCIEAPSILTIVWNPKSDGRADEEIRYVKYSALITLDDVHRNNLEIEQDKVFKLQEHLVKAQDEIAFYKKPWIVRMWLKIRLHTC